MKVTELESKQRWREEACREQTGGGGCWLRLVFLSLLVWTPLAPPETSSLETAAQRQGGGGGAEPDSASGPVHVSLSLSHPPSPLLPLSLAPTQRALAPSLHTLAVGLIVFVFPRLPSLCFQPAASCREKPLCVLIRLIGC